MTADDILDHLGLEAAPNDVVRCEVLSALIKYAKDVGNIHLEKAAVERFPVVNPWVPYKPWFDNYGDRFQCIADEDQGVDPDEWKMFGCQYWSALDDEGRLQRVKEPEMGLIDGEKDAENLNAA